MPKISREGGASYFPEGVTIRETDDPAIVAVAREQGANVVPVDDREAHELRAEERGEDGTEPTDVRVPDRANLPEVDDERPSKVTADNNDGEADDVERDEEPVL